MNIKRKVQFILSVFAAVCITAQVGVTAAPANYSEYKSGSTSVTSAGDDLKVKGSDFSASSNGKIVVENDGSITLGADETVDYKFNVPSDSAYNIKLSYAALTDNKLKLNIGIKLDGDYPFEEAESLSFSTAWNNETNDFDSDDKGNQLTPDQIMIDGFFTYPSYDDTGVEIKPYEFYLTAGTHTISVVANDVGFKLSSVALSPAENEAPYKEYIENYDTDSKNDAKAVVLQAEQGINKTSSALIPKSDTLNEQIKPADPKRIMLNYIGGTSWQTAGEQISWTFNAEKDGLYKFAFHYKQSDSINRASYRHLMVDGKTPFSEAREVKFDYTTSWKTCELGDGEEPYLVWLTAGEHTLTLEATLGANTADYYHRLGTITDNLNSIYLNIIKITSTSPDLNRDYDLFRQIPDLEKELTENRDLLNTLSNDIVANNGGDTNEISASLDNMILVIDKMLKSPYSSHQYITTFYSNFSSVSTWLQDIKKMPLSLDYVVVSPADYSNDDDHSFFSGIKFRFLRLLASFSSEYNTEVNDENTLTIWTGLGRDQANAIDTLIKQDFTPKTGVKVNLKIVAATLINGLLADDVPDVMLNMSRTQPVNYGVRNALYDLREFDDYDEVMKRFQNGADIPYTYNGKTYAIPTSQTFNVMFYRTDILEKLNLSVPQTWSEFLDASVTIQRNNMEVYLPYASALAGNAGIGSTGLYPTLMLQNGLSFYNEDCTATALNTPESISVFDNWIKMYTEYKIQKSADFYNRFRMGIMPLGIAPYSTYFNFVQMAPEIQGKYAMSLVPANDKTGSRAVAVDGGACAIVKKTKNPDAAWEFLKWYTSTDVVVEYSRRVESIQGLVGRIQTSNVEALSKMDWNNDQIAIINEQWKLAEEIPEVPGSYYLLRAVDQAYWSVINGKQNSKDAVAYWSASADAEIDRKYLEFANN